MALPLNLNRDQLEDFVEDELVKIANTLIPHEPGPDDLKAAKDYLPQFFGGLFPTLGLTVTRTSDKSYLEDKPDRPGRIIVQILIYYPCAPMQGVMEPQDDRTGPAKRLTRRIRGQFLAKVLTSGIFRGAIQIVESRGSPFDEAGNPISEELGRNNRALLWADGTELQITA